MSISILEPAMIPRGSSTPWVYWAFRPVFKHALRVFYSNIVLEGVEHLPSQGVPCILCPNHSNSLMDSLLLCTQIPADRREFIRPIAKSVLWGKGSFGSWLVTFAGAVPIKRRRDFNNGPVDNTESMGLIYKVLELGDMILMYPEERSRYHPSMFPLKTGVARIISDVLSRNRDNPDFEVAVATCSITYTHREHFRSDVLITFHPPMVFSPKMHPELLSPVTEAAIHSLTEKIRLCISAGTLDAPSWKVLRAAKLAANIYAPLGTKLSLGTYVRLVKRFVEVFKAAPTGLNTQTEDRNLEDDLNMYQDHLSQLGVVDDSIRDSISHNAIFREIIPCLIWGTLLGVMSLPGLLLWLPALLLSACRLQRYLRRGPASDTWDEIAEVKVSSGVIAGIPVWLSVSLGGLIYSPYSPVMVAALMWISLRWMEDAVAALRRAAVWGRLLIAPELKLEELRAMREDVHGRVFAVAIKELGLPENLEPETSIGAHIMDSSTSFLSYFSPLKRRKRNWNEVLRLYEKTDYPPDDSY